MEQRLEQLEQAKRTAPNDIEEDAERSIRAVATGFPPNTTEAIIDVDAFLSQMQGYDDEEGIMTIVAECDPRLKLHVRCGLQYRGRIPWCISSVSRPTCLSRCLCSLPFQVVWGHLILTFMEITPGPSGLYTERSIRCSGSRFFTCGVCDTRIDCSSSCLSFPQGPRTRTIWCPGWILSPLSLHSRLHEPNKDGAKALALWPSRQVRAFPDAHEHYHFCEISTDFPMLVRFVSPQFSVSCSS